MFVYLYVFIFFGLGLKVLAFLRFDRTHISDWLAETQVVQVDMLRPLPKRRPILALSLFFLLSFESVFNFAELLSRAKIAGSEVRINATR